MEDLELVDTAEEVDVSSLEKATEDAPVVKLVNLILMDAIRKKASDIHVEPYEKTFRVRYRIDGVLYEVMKPPMKLKNAITSRIKIMAELDIAERRLPQDGRIKIKLGAARTWIIVFLVFLPCLAKRSFCVCWTRATCRPISPSWAMSRRRWLTSSGRSTSRSAWCW